MDAMLKRWRERLVSREFWFAVWMCLLCGLVIRYAWHHQLIYAIAFAVMVVFFATIRDD